MQLIPLRNQDKVIVAYTEVDDEDFEWLNQWRWSYNSGYVKRGHRVNGKQVHVQMHRLLLGLDNGDPRQGDHIDRNPLNNQRSNLRVVTQAENFQNCTSYANTSSQYRGVSWLNVQQRWQAHAKLDGKIQNLGYYDNELEAAEVARQWRVQNMPFTTANDLTEIYDLNSHPSSRSPRRRVLKTPQRLSNEDRMQIRKRVESGEQHSAIASDFNIAISTVSNINRNRTVRKKNCDNPR